MTFGLLLLLVFLAFSFCIYLELKNRRLFAELSLLRHEIGALRKNGSEFVANVSHELKTPLTSILGYTETLKSAIYKDPEKATEFLDRIEENAGRLNMLIHDLLDLSRIESPNVHLEQSLFKIQELYQELQHEFQYKLAKRRQLLILRTDVEELFADRRLVFHALSNLIENAYRYCQDEALIEVDARANVEDSVSYVEFKVSDNGPGIGPADLPRIFERFYRAEKSRNRLSGGTGLGLAIVKHIVISHGGKVRAASELQKGSSFILQFPVFT